MALQTFTWIPDFSPRGQEKPRVLKSGFGDGYTQRVADGINTILPSWNFTFSGRSNTEYAAILAFLRARGGVEAFLFTAPSESVQQKWICAEWNMTPHDGDGGFYTLSATFEAQP